MTPNDTIAAGYRMGKALIHRMVDDLTPAEFAHQPCPGANSASWIIGHLAMTLRRTAERLGVTDLPPVAPDLVDRFTQTKKSADVQANLGDSNELLKLFDAGIEKVIDASMNVAQDKLAGPPSAPGPFANNFAEGMLFGSLHVAMHSGQLSTIRRSLGKPPVV